MRVQILSDLHFEFHRDNGAEFFQGLRPEGVDVLVLAGDISTRPGLEPVLLEFCDRYPQVVYVTGNHEYYQNSPDMVHGLLRKLGHERDNFHWLQHRKVEIDGIVFAGTTLWFPEPTGTTYERRFWLNDYNVIRGFVPWVYHEHREAVEFLEAEMASADIVVTHHMPASVCISPRFLKGDFGPMNHYFCHDMTPQIEQGGPKFWFYGHTHDRGQYKVRDTTLIGNPFGYPSEQGRGAKGRFNKKLVVEV